MANYQSGGSFLPNQDVQFTGTVLFSGATSFANADWPSAATASGMSSDTTLTGSAYAPSSHADQWYSKLTLTPATTVTAANGLNAIRGEVNLTSGKTLGSGSASYVTGVYGRGNIFGTVDIGSGDLAAVYAKFDLNGSTLTSGHIAPLQSNIVNPGATAAATTDLIYAESASGTKIKSGLSIYMAADYLMDLTDVGAVWFVGSAGASASKYLRVKCNGTAYKIALLADS